LRKRFNSIVKKIYKMSTIKDKNNFQQLTVFVKIYNKIQYI